MKKIREKHPSSTKMVYHVSDKTNTKKECFSDEKLIRKLEEIRGKGGDDCNVVNLRKVYTFLKYLKNQIVNFAFYYDV